MMTLDRAMSLQRALPVALLIFFWLWETWHPFFGWRNGRVRHAVWNLAVSIGNTVILALLFSVATAVVADWTARHQPGLLHLLPWGSVPGFLCAFLLLDVWTYLWHAANHHVSFLWRFHRMHHSDNRMDVTTATRFHLGELVLSKGIRLVLIPLLGLSLWEMVIYDLVLVAVTQFHHADISVAGLDRWLRWVIVTPDMHKVHHSRERPETDSNFSSVLSVWDRLGRTFCMRDNLKAIEFGLTEFGEPEWQTAWGMLKTPFARVPTSPARARPRHDPNEPKPPASE
jgi:sterol desaturase/sphingolipid hydroxylase (fatty acid hydroxylase superfamily)